MVEFNLSNDAIQSGLLPEYVNYILTATAYCLSKNNHAPGVITPIGGDLANKIKLSWEPISQAAINTLANPSTATEKGAEGIACVLVDRLTDYQVGIQSYIGTGFDFYLVSKEVEPSLNALSEGYIKLEISGIDRKSPTNTLEKRIKEKCQQAATLKDGIDYLVVVAEFGDPRVEVRHGSC
jgi:hypothetical protein